MLQSLSIKVPYIYAAEQHLSDLQRVNYFYGSNGSGKTTLARVIADFSKYPECKPTWQNGRELQTRVYNADFVRENFTSDCDLKSIFTLGADSAALVAEIDKAKQERDGHQNKIDGKKRALHGEDGLGGKKRDLSKVEDDFKEYLWKNVKTRYYNTEFKSAFVGRVTSKEVFRDFFVKEAQKTDNHENITHADLEKRAGFVFSSNPEKIGIIELIYNDSIKNMECNEILQKNIVGKHDVSIANMIHSLNNSDWVKQGRKFFEQNNHEKCPFCQQDVNDSLRQNLEDYFDITYEEDLRILDVLRDNYQSETVKILSMLNGISDAQFKFLDSAYFEQKKHEIEQKINMNIVKISEKKKSPSAPVNLGGC